MYLVDATVICATAGLSGIVSGQGYTLGRGDAARRSPRLRVWPRTTASAKVYGRFTETVFQNITNIWFFSRRVAERVSDDARRHEPLGGHPSVFVGGVDLPAWSGSGPFPADGTCGRCAGGTGIQIEDWQGTGRNYRLVYPTQVTTTLAWHHTQSESWMLPPPECGTTLGETWERCGMPLAARRSRRERRWPCRGSRDSWRCQSRESRWGHRAPL